MSADDDLDDLARGSTSVQAASIQVLLAEKRTSLAVLRTGIAVAVVPLSITTVLVTLSKFYSWVDNLHFLIPMYAIMTGLVILSGYLITRAMIRIKHYDHLIAEMRNRCETFKEILE